MGAIASQITSLTIVYSIVYSGTDKKHQSSASLAFVWGIHRGPGNSPHKWPVTRKMFPFDDIIMCSSWYRLRQIGRLPLSPMGTNSNYSVLRNGRKRKYKRKMIIVTGLHLNRSLNRSHSNMCFPQCYRFLMNLPNTAWPDITQSWNGATALNLQKAP